MNRVQFRYIAHKFKAGGGSDPGKKFGGKKRKEKETKGNSVYTYREKIEVK
jgi:hypothetical protein